MEWSVLATFAGVLVAAAGAAWAIVREQSVIRQLERVTAVLTDVPEGSPGHAHLVVVRADLARRLNETYRAPRHWFRAFAGWTFWILAALAFVLAYVYAYVGLTALLPLPVSRRDFTPRDWFELAGVFVGLSVGAFFLAGAALLGRSRKRRAWLDGHNADEADRPSV